MRNSVKYLAVALLFVILVAEIGLRFAGLGDPPIVELDKEIEYFPKPNSEFHRFGNLIKTNRYGMRSEDHDLSDASQHFVVIGDSVVYGNHFLDQGDTIPYQLAAQVTDYKVSSVAASSWGPGNIKAFIDRHQPIRGEVAFLVQSSHDRVDIPFTSPYLIPYRRTESYGAIHDVLTEIYERGKRAALKEKLRTVAYEEAIKETELDLVAAIDTLKAEFDEVFLVYHPSMPELGRVTNAEKYYKTLASKQQIGFINHRLVYELYPAPAELYKDNIHLSAAGAAYFAESLKVYMQGGKSNSGPTAK